MPANSLLSVPAVTVGDRFHTTSHNDQHIHSPTALYSAVHSCETARTVSCWSPLTCFMQVHPGVSTSIGLINRRISAAKRSGPSS
ncbi:hypothetical protein DAEQUDRAFT_728024 [Daedalea quercina L-15889]|uniref:Uncharacterized protein n=1 Tax=Daedalea quercina L-15889 TaxID=1314783 RepID=A0A165PHM3_9APHY|nr:hypothetical protein DAEQUDRAFT_728024 [Daedalea quercina L-15889]